MSNNEDFSRLPSWVLPIKYSICLKPCLQKFTFAGEVEVTLKILELTNTIIMNAAEIRPSSAQFFAKDSNPITGFISLQEKEETVTLKFDECLAVGEGTLKISYDGILNNKMKGFYRNQYEVDGETKYGAVTQFAATDARRCFPCWDEPAVKAKFDVTLVVPEEMNALSNMNIIVEAEYNEDPGWKQLKYATTPTMSTYLLAFVIGEFDFVEKRASNGVPVRVYTPKGKSYRGQFALDIALRCLQYYEEYFDIPYPLPKLDLIAIADFSCGAM